MRGVSSCLAKLLFDPTSIFEGKLSMTFIGTGNPREVQSRGFLYGGGKSEIWEQGNDQSRHGDGDGD